MRRLFFTALMVVFASCTNSAAVQPPVVPARVTILGPHPLYVDINSYERVLSHVYDSSGALLDNNVRVAWSSADTTIVVIDSAGTLNFRNQLGVTVIRAAVDTNGAHVSDSVEVHPIRLTPLNKVGSSLSP